MAEDPDLPACKAVAASVVASAFRDLTDPKHSVSARRFLLHGLWRENLPWAGLLDLDREQVSARVTSWDGRRLRLAAALGEPKGLR